MDPLNDDEKRTIVGLFRALERAVNAHSYAVELAALRNAYRGDRSLIDGFESATDKGRALQQIRRALMDEIDAAYWLDSN